MKVFTSHYFGMVYNGAAVWLASQLDATYQRIGDKALTIEPYEPW